MNTAFDTLIVSVGWALVRFVWQGALIGCLCAALLLAARNRSPQLRYLIACMALGACMMLPLFDGWQVWNARLDAMPSPDNAAADVAGMEIDAGWLGLIGGHMKILVLSWAGCSTLLALRLALGLAWISRTFGGGRRDANLQTMLDRLAARMGMVKAVRLRVAEGLASPLAAGVWRATIVVPAALAGGMPPDLLEALLAHELAHVRRHDYLVNLLQNLVETLLFYHPAVWWISRRIRIERELIADSLAAEAIGEPRRLALALSELEKLQLPNCNLAQAANGGILMQRIKKLVSPEAQAMNWKAAIPALGLALACFAGYVQAASSANAVRDRAKPQFVDLMSCKPDYPVDLRNKGVTGTVTTQITVDASGKVVKSAIVKSSGNAQLDDYTRAALAKCGFKPAVHQGKPVQASLKAMYVWKLED